MLSAVRMEERIRQAVFERDNYTCRYCGSKEGPFHADHVYPWSKGGETSINNIVTACRHCNISKHDKVGIWPKPMGYFEPEPVRKNVNVILYWAITDFVLAFFAALHGDKNFAIVAFVIAIIQSLILAYMVFNNIRFDEMFPVETDEDETE